jgi:hypothetical protein
MASAHSSLHRRRILRHSTIAFIGVGLAAAIPLAAQPSRRKFRIGMSGGHLRSRSSSRS